MSEAKRKAKELVDRFRMYDVQICDLMFEELDGYEERHYKKCALICVDENIKIQNSWLRYFNNKDYIVTDAIEYKINELYDIKQEIEKL